MGFLLTHIADKQALENSILTKTHKACIGLLGFLFGTASYFAIFDEVKQIGLPYPLVFAIFIIVGVLIIYAYYLSFLGVMWAMAKLFKGKNKFWGFTRVAANALPPLWFALPIINFYLVYGLQGNIAISLFLIGVASLLLFFGRMIKVASLWFGMTVKQSTLSLVTTIVFFSSFLYLQFG